MYHTGVYLLLSLKINYLTIKITRAHRNGAVRRKDQRGKKKSVKRRSPLAHVVVVHTVLLLEEQSCLVVDSRHPPLHVVQAPRQKEPRHLAPTRQPTQEEHEKK